MLSSYEFLKLLQTCIAFSALMLFVGQKEGYLACKNWLLVCWWLWFDWIFACLRVPVLITTSISSCCGRTQNSLTGLSCKLAMKECVYVMQTRNSSILLFVSTQLSLRSCQWSSFSLGLWEVYAVNIAQCSAVEARRTDLVWCWRTARHSHSASADFALAD